MSTIKALFGAATAITVTLASLATNSWRQSAVVDNSSDLFLDVLIAITVKTGATAAGSVDVWAYATVDEGTTYSDGATGSDAAFTPTANPNLVFLGSIQTPSTTTVYTSRTFSLAQAFGGSVPKKWGLAIHNNNGGNLDSTEGNHIKKYQGVQQSVV